MSTLTNVEYPEDAGTWIDPKRKLPKDGSRVIAANRRGTKTDIGIAEYEEGVFTNVVSQMPYKNVIYWLEIPALPEE